MGLTLICYNATVHLQAYQVFDQDLR